MQSLDIVAALASYEKGEAALLPWLFATLSVSLYASFSWPTALLAEQLSTPASTSLFWLGATILAIELAVQLSEAALSPHRSP